MDKDKRFTFRLPTKLFKAVAKAAEKEGRSISGQICWLLGRAIKNTRGNL